MADSAEGALTTQTFVLGPIHEPAKGLQASLVGMEGSVFGKRYLLARTRISIGRSSACDITIEDTGVSRRHAEIRHVGHRYVVADCGSKNGTLVNDVRHEHAELEDGMFLRIGGATFKFLRMTPVERRYHDELAKQSHEDALTGAFNRRHVWGVLESEIARVARYGGSMALVMFDIDHFKRLNDTYGHAAGDLALKGIVARVHLLLRRSDTLARIGGEEFVIVLPETDILEAAELATRVRDAVSAEPFAIGTTTPVAVTVSLGVTDFGELMQSEAPNDSPDTDDASNGGTRRTADGDDIEASTNRLVALADAKLYEAKHLGRNRVAL
jgi:two-component system, cell cycle response regulator